MPLKDVLAIRKISALIKVIPARISYLESSYIVERSDVQIKILQFRCNSIIRDSLLVLIS